MSSSCGVCKDTIEPPKQNQQTVNTDSGHLPKGCVPGVNCTVQNKYRIKYAMVKAVLQYYPQLGRS